MRAAGSHEHDSRILHAHEHEHENFSWTIPSDHDDRSSLSKKLRIGPVMAQQSCGSCWAFAVCSAMSDCLVVGEAVNWMPLISPTFCLACYPQDRCGGGQPALLALDIERNGVADQTCIDYSWCDGNKGCSVRDSSTHFKANSRVLSNMIPSCGCVFKNNKYLYYLDKGSDTFSITPSMPVEKFRRLVKYHILDFGPVVGGFLVLTNFINGQFTQTNQGVYFDRADYGNIGKDGVIHFSDSVKSSVNSAGLHAVSIVGWGIAKSVQYDNNKVGDVPFWYCRNSWGERWGDKGFFKIAMYPYNQTSQFDKIVSVYLKGWSGTVGGLMFIRATKPPKIATIKQIPNETKSALVLNEPLEFYNRNITPGEGIVPDQTPPPRRGFPVIIIIIVGALGLLWLYSKYSSSSVAGTSWSPTTSRSPMTSRSPVPLPRASPSPDVSQCVSQCVDKCISSSKTTFPRRLPSSSMSRGTFPRRLPSSSMSRGTFPRRLPSSSMSRGEETFPKRRLPSSSISRGEETFPKRRLPSSSMSRGEETFSKVIW